MAPGLDRYYEYANASDGATTATVTDGRGASTDYELDGRDRPTSITGAAGDPAETRTEIEWDGSPSPDDNNVTSITRGANDPDSTSTVAYIYGNENGLLTRQEQSVYDYDAEEPRTRAIGMGYCASAGYQLNADDELVRSEFGTDSGGQFVQDQVSMQLPKEGSTWRYGLDGKPRTATQDDASYCSTLDEETWKGRQTLQIDPLGKPATSAYDDYGQLIAEVDEEGGRTTYSRYDESGNPQVVIDPEAYRGAGQPSDQELNRRTWLYRYDVVGNLLAVTDPRAEPDGQEATLPVYGETGALTTTYTYDELDRVTKMTVPRKTDGQTHASGGSYVTSQYSYDSIDNVTETIDGMGEVWRTDYTPMGLPQTQTSPPVPVSAGGFEPGASEALTSRFCYDGEEGLVKELTPKASPGAGCAGTQAHTTSSVLDALGRVQAVIQGNSGGGESLVTSFGYDKRGNQVATWDPARNDGEPLADVLDPARDDDPRLKTEFNEADEPIFRQEDPGGLNIRTEIDYDLNGNAVRIVTPRGFESGGQLGDYDITRTYDVKDQLIDSTDQLGNTTRYEYDDVGRTTAVTDPRGTASEAVGDDTSLEVVGDATVKMTYDKNGDLESRSVPWTDRQYGLDNAILDSPANKITYERDAVGNPTLITDARGNEIRNEFYDTGELAWTTDPWWWRLDWSSGAENPAAGRMFTEGGGGLTADFAMPAGGPSITEAGTYPSEGGGSMPSGPMAGDFGNVRPEQLPDFMPRSGETTLAYDDLGRLKSVSGQPSGAPGDPQSVRSLDYDALGRVTDKWWSFGTTPGSPGSPGGTDIRHEFRYDANGNLTGYLDGAGAAGELAGSLPVDADDYLTQFDYDAFDRRTAEHAPGSLETPLASQIDQETTRWCYDANSNVTARLTPRHTQGGCASLSGNSAPPFGFSYQYDPLDRLIGERNPIQSAWSYEYDAASNLEQMTDPRLTVTQNSFDEADRLTEVTEAEGTGVERSTSYELDEVGNVTTIVAPGAKPYPGAPMASRVTKIDYDFDGRPWLTRSGRAEGNDPTMAREARTELIQRDVMGNSVRTVVGEGYADRSNFNSYSDQTGWSASSLEAPTKDATVSVFDDNGLLGRTYLPHGDGAVAPDSLETDASEDDTRYALDYVYDERGRLSQIWQAHRLGSDATTTIASYRYFDTDWIKSASDARDELVSDPQFSKDQSVRYRYDRRGIQTDWFTDGYQADQVDVGSRRIQRVINPSGTLASRSGKLYTEAFDPDEGGAEPGSVEVRTYDYFYNENRSLVQIDDRVPEFTDGEVSAPLLRTTLIGRDTAERETDVDENWPTGRDTAMIYDASNNLLHRRVEGAFDGNGEYDGGRTSSFTYDALGREKTMEVAGRFSTTTWWPSDQIQQRTKLNGVQDEDESGEVDEDNPGTTEWRYYLRSGDTSQKVRIPEEGDQTTQTYDYDLNGNTLFDERGSHVFNARDQLVRWDRPSTDSGDRGYGGDDSEPDPGDRNYADDPADYPQSGHVTYVLDGTGQMVSTREESGFDTELRRGGTVLPDRASTDTVTTSTYNYENGDLKTIDSHSVIDTTGIPNPPPDDTDRQVIDTRTYYENYDDMGNVGQIRVEELDENGNDKRTTPPEDETPTAPGCPQSSIDNWTDAETTYYCFDQFGRLAVSQGNDKDAAETEDLEDDPTPDDRETEEPEAWLYDGIDRRDARIIVDPDDADRFLLRDRSYVGTTELLSSELDYAADAENDREDLERKTYDYDSRGIRLGQQRAEQGPGVPAAPEYSTYDNDALGSVIGLEDEEGTFDDPGSSGDDTDNSYDLDPYGTVLDPDPGNAEADVEEELGEAASENPFRFEGFYYDSGVESYDMLARQYRPDAGRFLSQDRFEAAAGDLALQSDPLTQNRYAFAGGNPVTNIEWDGHRVYGSGSASGETKPRAEEEIQAAQSETAANPVETTPPVDPATLDSAFYSSTVGQNVLQLGGYVCYTTDLNAPAPPGMGPSQEGVAEANPIEKNPYDEFFENAAGGTINTLSVGIVDFGDSNSGVYKTFGVGADLNPKGIVKNLGEFGIKKVDNIIGSQADDVAADVASKPTRFITTPNGYTVDRAAIPTSVSAQKQAEHVRGSSTYKGGGYFDSADEAQEVLNAFHDGRAQILGGKGQDIVVRFDGVTGTNVNPGSGFPSQPTDVFFIKGTTRASVVPYNPTWKP